LAIKTGHALNGIHHQVQDHLFQLNPVTLDGWKSGAKIGAQ
jgi:hypothetical protein